MWKNAHLFLRLDYSPPHPPPGIKDYPGANPYPSLKEQKAFEKGLIEKTAKSKRHRGTPRLHNANFLAGNTDVILYDNRVVVFKSESDVMLYVVGPADENEILLFNVILSLRDSLNLLLKASTDKRTIIENYDLVSLAVDEIIDDGIILETDPVVVASRVSKPPAQDVSMKGIDLSEQGLLNAWEFAKMKGLEKLRQGM